VLLGPLLGASLKNVHHTEPRPVVGRLPTQLISVCVHAMFGLINGRPAPFFPSYKDEHGRDRAGDARDPAAGCYKNEARRYVFPDVTVEPQGAAMLIIQRHEWSRTATA
jgi:hypothetical protein